MATHKCNKQYEEDSSVIGDLTAGANQWRRSCDTIVRRQDNRKKTFWYTAKCEYQTRDNKGLDGNTNKTNTTTTEDY